MQDRNDQGTSEEVRWNVIVVDGCRYDRLPLPTGWLTAGDDLTRVLRVVTDGRLRVGDTVVVSEKAAVVTAGGSLPAARIQVGALSRFLARRVRPVGASRGLSVPEKMQYVLDVQGTPRVVVAALAAGITRVFGVRGTFYRIAGDLARDLDGMRPPYEGVLIPPLPPTAARATATRLARELGVHVAIVDISDRGGSVRGCSPGAPAAPVLLRVLADNPLGQRDRGTPVGIVRSVPTGSGPVGSLPGAGRRAAARRG